MDAILLIIGIVYGVCRIVIKSVQQCTYFLFSVNLHLVGVNSDKEPCKFAVNKRQNTNYSFLPMDVIGNFKTLKGALATILTKKIICLEIGK
jgi:hypothetical protein